MCKLFSVIRYEYKMQFKSLPAWGMLFAAAALSLLDNFPSAGNLARLEFLNNPAYFVYRIMSLDSLVLLFGFMFLLAGRIPLDTKTGMKPLLMSSALKKDSIYQGNCLADFFLLSQWCAFFLYWIPLFILQQLRFRFP